MNTPGRALLIATGALGLCALTAILIGDRNAGAASSHDVRNATMVEDHAPPPRALPPPVHAPAIPRRAPAQTSIAQEVEGRLVASIRAQLEGNVKHAEYLQCLASSTTEHYCPSLYADAVNLAMGEAGTYDAAKALRARIDALGPFDRAEARAAVARVAESSPDALTRIAALKVLSFETETEHPPLSEATYANLTSKPLVESLLLARRHILAPVPNEQIANDFARLAESPDSRVRAWALRALGHEETAEQLNHALKDTVIESTEPMAVARAVVACGARCLPSVTRMMQGSIPDREAMYEMLTFAAPESLQAIALAIREHPPRDAREAAVRDEMFLNAGVRRD